MIGKFSGAVAAAVFFSLSSGPAAAGTQEKLGCMAETAAAAAESGDYQAASALLDGLFSGGAALPAPQAVYAGPRPATEPAAPAAAYAGVPARTGAEFEEGGWLDEAVVQDMMEQLQAEFSASAPQEGESPGLASSLLGGMAGVLAVMFFLVFCPVLMIAVF